MASRRHRRVAPLAIALAALLALCGVSSGAASAARGLPGRQGPVRLDTVAPPAATPAAAVGLGSLPVGSTLHADVVLRPHHPGRLAALAAAVATPGSPERGEYRSPAELRALFSPTRAEVGAVAAALRHLGLETGTASADRLTIPVSGSVTNMSRALHTEFAQFRLPGGRVAFANTAPARLPSAIGRRVQSVVGLSSIARYRSALRRPRRAVRRAGAAAIRSTTAASATPTICRGAEKETYTAFTADQLAAAYGMDGLYGAGDRGQGVTVGVYELESNLRSDIARYEACYGIATQVHYVKVDGGATGPLGGSGEAALDIEDVAGLAPRAHIRVYQAPNNNVGPFDELQYIVDHPSASVVTTSWGECEQMLGTNGSRKSAIAAADAEAVLFELAAAEGQSWVAASGDDGSSDCLIDGIEPARELAVDDPGADPYVTSVGGTSLRVGESSRSERVWNDLYGAGGGGLSHVWPMPAYQLEAPASLGVLEDRSSSTPCRAVAVRCREVPDVSADADPLTGYIQYWDRGWAPIGGTSGAAPLWAAVVALSDASSGCGGRSLGYLNPALYAVASSSTYPTDFHDVTLGNNDFTSSGNMTGLYAARHGYDMASGLGTPIVSSTSGGLAAALCASLGAATPQVNEVAPASGPRSGGNQVVVTGYRFSHVRAVDVGGRPATFTVRDPRAPDPTAIVVTVPPGSGREQVVVRTAGGSSPRTAGDLYRYTG